MLLSPLAQCCLYTAVLVLLRQTERSEEHRYNESFHQSKGLWHATMQRWTFPFVPDTNLLPLSGNQGVSSYTMSLARLELTYK